MSNRIIIILFFSFLFLALNNSDSYAQGVFTNIDPSTVNIDDLTESQISQINERIKSEGLSIPDALELAKVQGLPEAEASKLQMRLMQLQSSGSGTLTNSQTNNSLIDDEVEDIPDDENLKIMTPVGGTETGPAIIMDADDPEDYIYGHSIFLDQTLDVFTTTDAARAPDWYVLGTGDQIRVTIFGVSQTDLLLEISDEGYVQPTGGQRIFLKGLTIKEARSILQTRLEELYTFNEDEFAITIKAARTITVNIFGEARAKGGFTISALNTAFNALTVAGGPTSIGSVRNIQLIRGTERKIIDVYEFLTDPTIQTTLTLRHNDIIFVPVAEEVVQISGAVKRPMRYELKDKEGLKELIEFAGGINFNTATDFVQIQRVVNGEPILLEYELSDVLEGTEIVPLQNGDIIRVRTIGRELEKFVTIEGSIYYPGRYDLGKNSTLNTLLDEAQLRPETMTEQIFLERKRDDNSTEIIPINLDSLQKTKADLILEREDNLILFSKERYRNLGNIEVQGQVRSPFSRSLLFDDRLSVNDALQLAGGLLPTAYDKAYIFRTDLFNPKRNEILSIDLQKDLNFLLRPGDELRIYNLTDYTDIASIEVVGEVRSPFSREFTFEETIKLEDALHLAGGLKPTAANSAYIFRTDLFNPDIVTHIMVDLSKDLDIELNPGDQLRVYNVQDYTDLGNLSIQGAVGSTFSTTYDSTLTVSDMILMAGGLSRNAALNNVEVFRLNISLERGTLYDIIKLEIGPDMKVIEQPNNFKLQPFDKIIVRRIPEYNFGATIEINGEVKYPGIYPVDGQRLRLTDVIKLAGGLTTSADPQNATILRSTGNVGPIGVDLAAALDNENNYTTINPVILENDVIRIPEYENIVQIRINGTRYGDLREDSLIAESNALSDDNTINIIYRGNKNAKWYIDRFAGGLGSEADKWSVTITNPNGEVKGVKRRLIFFKNYPQVEPGSIITLRNKIPKPERDGPRFDFQELQTRTLSAATTLLTILILADRLQQ